MWNVLLFSVVEEPLGSSRVPNVPGTDQLLGGVRHESHHTQVAVGPSVRGDAVCGFLVIENATVANA